VKALKVLVAEDDHALRSFYQLALIEHGHAVNAVGNGLEAMDAIGPDIDLLITDLVMPIMRGDELLAELRARPELREIPVLVVTAHPGDLRPDLRNGRTVVLQKPFQLDDFITRVEAAAGLRAPSN
jgi:two-component system, cell cycle response regulator CpdR